MSNFKFSIFNLQFRACLAFVLFVSLVFNGQAQLTTPTGRQLMALPQGASNSVLIAQGGTNPPVWGPGAVGALTNLNVTNVGGGPGISSALVTNGGVLTVTNNFTNVAALNALLSQGSSVTNALANQGTALTNSFLALGANDTNFTKAVGTSVTNALANQGTALTNSTAAAIAAGGVAATNAIKVATNTIAAASLTGTVPYAALAAGVVTNNNQSAVALDAGLYLANRTLTNSTLSINELVGTDGSKSEISISVGVGLTLSGGVLSNPISGSALTNFVLSIGQAATNAIAGLGLNDTNFAKTIGTSLTNALAGQGTAVTNAIAALGVNDTNFTKAVGTAVTNALAATGTADTNFAQAIGTSVTNAIAALGANGTNFTKAVGTSVTNLITANGTATTNDINAQVANLGVNDTNFAKAIGTSLTNALAAQGTATTNYGNTQSNGITASFNLQLQALGPAVTNAIANQGTAVTNAIKAATNTIAGASLTGTIPVAVLPSAALTNNEVANVSLNGTFTVHSNGFVIGELATTSNFLAGGSIGTLVGFTNYALLNALVKGNDANGQEIASPMVRGLTVTPAGLKSTNGQNTIWLTDVGGDPTGATDSGTALTNLVNAIQHGGVGYIPAGRYLITNGFQFLGGGVPYRIFGDDGKSILDFHIPVTNAFCMYAWGGGLPYLELDHFVVQNTNNSVKLFFDGSAPAHIHHMQFYGCTTGYGAVYSYCQDAIWFGGFGTTQLLTTTNSAYSGYPSEVDHCGFGGLGAWVTGGTYFNGGKIWHNYSLAANGGYAAISLLGLSSQENAVSANLIEMISTNAAQVSVSNYQFGCFVSNSVKNHFSGNTYFDARNEGPGTNGAVTTVTAGIHFDKTSSNNTYVAENADASAWLPPPLTASFPIIQDDTGGLNVGLDWNQLSVYKLQSTIAGVGIGTNNIGRETSLFEIYNTNTADVDMNLFGPLAGIQFFQEQAGVEGIMGDDIYVAFNALDFHARAQVGQMYLDTAGGVTFNGTNRQAGYPFTVNENAWISNNLIVGGIFEQLGGGPIYTTGIFTNTGGQMFSGGGTTNNTLGFYSTTGFIGPTFSTLSYATNGFASYATNFHSFTLTAWTNTNAFNVIADFPTGVTNLTVSNSAPYQLFTLATAPGLYSRHLGPGYMFTNASANVVISAE